MDPEKGVLVIIEKRFVYILQKHEIKVGDKVAGRRENKCIISKLIINATKHFKMEKMFSR